MSDTLLALAKAQQERHHAVAYGGHRVAYMCVECQDDYPCTSRAFADRVVEALEAQAARDEQIRQHLKAIQEMVGNKNEASSKAFYLFVRERDAILALLAAANAPTEGGAS